MYVDADILVLPSFYEGLPNVAIEALASGCRLVAAAGAGGTREFMAALGLGEFLVPSDTFAAGLEDAVARACESPASVWQQAWTTLAERVRPEAAAGHVWQFLDEVAASCAR
jgi:glycosyltransferase involved in cell wall biosynthesis